MNEYDSKFGLKVGDEVFVLHNNKKYNGKVTRFTDKFVCVEINFLNRAKKPVKKEIRKKPINVSKDEILINYKMISILKKIIETSGLEINLEEIGNTIDILKEKYPELYIKLIS